MTYFSGDFGRRGGDRCLSVEIVSYYYLNVIKKTKTLSCVSSIVKFPV